jgi:hypothetical protein
MTVHLAVFALMLAGGYLAVAVGGVAGDWMMLVPPAFLIYLASSHLLSRRRKRKHSP